MKIDTNIDLVSAYGWGNFEKGVVYKNQEFSDFVSDLEITQLNKEITNHKNSLNPEIIITIGGKTFFVVKIEKDIFFVFTNLNSIIDSKLKEQFNTFKEIGHDLNNVLSTILTANTYLIELMEKDEKASKVLDVIKLNLDRAVLLTSKLMSKNKESNKLIETIDLKKILEILKIDLERTLPQNILLKFKVDDNLNKINADKEDIYRALFNICINAKEAIAGNGTLSIKSRNKDEKVIINITDTGEGISKENIKKIFDLGFSTKIKKNESGIGLSIVKKIISQYSGKIKVSSKLGKGTNFELIFPAVIYKADAIESSKGVNILLADDEEDMLDLLTELLTSYNYNVTTVKDGEQLLEKVTDNKEFDLLIIDENMPKMKGVECIKQIRSRGIDTKIVLCSGAEIDNKSVLINKLHINYFLVKPYNFDNLLEIISKLIGS